MKLAAGIGKCRPGPGVGNVGRVQYLREAVRSFRRCLACLVPVFLWIASITGCSSYEGGGDVQRQAQQGAGQDLLPIAVVEETEGHLGIVDPSENIEKQFVIRNEGNAPLLLERGGTSCTCTMSDLPNGPIEPGESAIVVVSTKSEEKTGSFDHTASVLTNDPDNQRITFRITGKFQKTLAFDPPKIVVSGVKLNASKTVRAVVYSEVFRGFELDSIDSTLDGLTWKVELADEMALRDLEARCGYRLTLNLPPSAETGDFSETLTVSVCSDDEPPITMQASCRIARSVEPRATFTGKNYLPFNRTLTMGSFRRWQGGSDHITLAVRDDHPVLDVKEIRKSPDFLEVDVEPMVPDKLDSGLYWIHVKVPKDAPPSNYTGSRTGEIEIVTDHPTLKVFSFRVQFAVTSG